MTVIDYQGKIDGEAFERGSGEFAGTGVLAAAGGGHGGLRFVLNCCRR